MTTLEQGSPGQSRSRLDGVDLLRGLAISFVLMNHINMQLLFARVFYTKGLPKQLEYFLVWNGQQGVQIFFAISGFLITATSLRRWCTPSRVSITDFYKLRFARIAPMLLALLAMLSMLHLAHIRSFVVPQGTGGLRGALFAALTFHVNLLEAQRGYLPGSWDILWSLSVEEMFYLLFPIACRLLTRSRLVGLLMMLVVLGPFGRSTFHQGNAVWREYSYLGGMDAIALGCLTAILLDRRHLTHRTQWGLFALGALLMFVTEGFSVALYQCWLESSGLYMTLVAVGACMLIAAAEQSRWRCPRLLAPLLQMGRRSYEIYLTHMFVVFLLSTLFLRAGKPMLMVPVLFVSVIAIAVFLGMAVARYYSEPMNHLLRRKWVGDAKTLRLAE